MPQPAQKPGSDGRAPRRISTTEVTATRNADAETVAAETGKSSTHPTQRHTPGP